MVHPCRAKRKRLHALHAVGLQRQGASLHTVHSGPRSRTNFAALSLPKYSQPDGKIHRGGPWRQKALARRSRCCTRNCRWLLAMQESPGPLLLGKSFAVGSGCDSGRKATKPSAQIVAQPHTLRDVLSCLGPCTASTSRSPISGSAALFCGFSCGCGMTSIICGLTTTSKIARKIADPALARAHTLAHASRCCLLGATAHRQGAACCAAYAACVEVCRNHLVSQGPAVCPTPPSSSVQKDARLESNQEPAKPRKT